MQVKGLAHRDHWRGPQGAFFERFGAVKASPLAAYKLLRDGHAVLLFPGGAAEVLCLASQEPSLLLVRLRVLHKRTDVRGAA